MKPPRQNALVLASRIPRQPTGSTSGATSNSCSQLPSDPYGKAAGVSSVDLSPW